MINVEKITLTGGMIFGPTKVYNNTDIKNLGIPLWYEDATVGVETEEGKLIIPSYKIIDIHITKHRRRIREDLSRRVKRISLSGEMTYGPCYLILPEKHVDAGIPQIFRPYEQFNFTAYDGLHITSDFNVCGILL